MKRQISCFADMEHSNHNNITIIEQGNSNEVIMHHVLGKDIDNFLLTQLTIMYLPKVYTVHSTTIHIIHRPLGPQYKLKKVCYLDIYRVCCISNELHYDFVVVHKIWRTQSISYMKSGFRGLPP